MTHSASVTTAGPVIEGKRGGTWRNGTALLCASSLRRFVGRAHHTTKLLRRHRGRIAGLSNRALSLCHVRALVVSGEASSAPAFEVKSVAALYLARRMLYSALAALRSASSAAAAA